MPTTIHYAKGPVRYLYDLETRTKKKKELLWGDWIRVSDELDDEWFEVKWGKERFALKQADCQRERLLELIFLDVGQGDSCILTTPFIGSKERILVVDAGLSDNTDRYLNWRFRDFKRKFKFHAAVITHPDSDHYRGFQSIFENEQVSFEHVYHNGLLERTGSNLLGEVKEGFVTEIYKTKTAARELYSDESLRGRKLYPKLLWTALNSDRFDDVSMLSTERGDNEDGRTYMPGFAPSRDPEFTIEVLGPVVEQGPDGQALRTFGRKVKSTAMDKGKTKNGHSILLRLQYHAFSILFGGDLNAPAEHFLMRHYGNGGEAPETIVETNTMIAAARERFGVDMMKTCHHGSSDVTEEFLEATEPAAFVVSSGDDESHVHPRPDLLGLLGKKGRGPRPLILATELQRSTRERENTALRRKLDRLAEAIAGASSAEDREPLVKEREEVLDEIFKRNVGVYGAINVRTDGHSVVVAFRKERSKGVKRWFYYELKQDSKGTLQVVVEDGH